MYHRDQAQVPHLSENPTRNCKDTTSVDVVILRIGSVNDIVSAVTIVIICIPIPSSSWAQLGTGILITTVFLAAEYCQREDRAS